MTDPHKSYLQQLADRERQNIETLEAERRARLVSDEIRAAQHDARVQTEKIALQVRSLEEAVRSTSMERRAVLLGETSASGGCALLLIALGLSPIFGTLWYLQSERTAELRQQSREAYAAALVAHSALDEEVAVSEEHWSPGELQPTITQAKVRLRDYRWHQKSGVGYHDLADLTDSQEQVRIVGVSRGQWSKEVFAADRTSKTKVIAFVRSCPRYLGHERCEVCDMSP